MFITRCLLSALFFFFCLTAEAQGSDRYPFELNSMVLYDSSGAINMFASNENAYRGSVAQPATMSTDSEGRRHIGIVQKFESVMSRAQKVLDRVPLKNIKILSYRTDIMISLTHIRITVHF